LGTTNPRRGGAERTNSSVLSGRRKEVGKIGIMRVSRQRIGKNRLDESRKKREGLTQREKDEEGTEVVPLYEILTMPLVQKQ